MMPPADQICEQDPGRVVHTRQEAGSSDFLAVGLALFIVQLNMEGLSTAKHSVEATENTSTENESTGGWNMQVRNT